MEIAPCPGCQAKLSVERSDLGSDVECPYCKTVFKAKLPGSGGSGTAGGGSTRRPARQDEDEDVLSGIPRGGSLRSDDDDDRPSRRSRMRDEDEEEEERPSRRGRRRDEDEEEEEERPRRRRRSGGGGGTDNPIFGILALVGGILGIVMSCCCGFFGIPFDAAAIILGAIGMKKDAGRGMAIAGLICGVVGLVLVVLGLILNIGMNLGGGGFQNNPRFR